MRDAKAVLSNMVAPLATCGHSNLKKLGLSHPSHILGTPQAHVACSYHPTNANREGAQKTKWRPKGNRKHLHSINIHGGPLSNQEQPGETWGEFRPEFARYLNSAVFTQQIKS